MKVRRMTKMEFNKARLNGMVSLLIYLIDALLVTAFVSCIVTGRSSAVTKVFMIETFVMAGIGFVLVMRAGKYIDEEDE